MGVSTKIEWCHHTWSPWHGCTRVSPGCQHCYAERLSIRNPDVLGQWGPKGTRVVSKSWSKPIVWSRSARKSGERRRIFPSLCDWLEDRPELVEPREFFAATIEASANLDWLLLTKRPGNIGLADDAFGWDTRAHGLPPNVWHGTSVEDQERAASRLDDLLKTRSIFHWVSAEPLLGPLNLAPWMGIIHEDQIGASNPDQTYIFHDPWMAGIDWVVIGGESGPNARPCDLSWVRSIIEQCQLDRVSVYVKQLGSNPTEGGKRVPGIRDPKGGDINEWPIDLRIREMPNL